MVTINETSGAYQLVKMTGGWVQPTLTREKIEEFEKILIGMETDDPVCTMKHYFAGGLYAREMFMPKGTVLTGAVHKTEHLVVVVGDVMCTVDGAMQRLQGHNTFVSKPGAKRAMFAHEDTYVTCFIVTDKTDVVEIENDVVENPDSLQYRRFALKALKG